MRGDAHVRFGGRAEEPDRPTDRHRASARPYVWRDQAEHVAGSLARGSRVMVTGRLQQRSWTAEGGSARSVVEVVRDHLEEIRDVTGYSVPAGSPTRLLRWSSASGSGPRRS